MEDYEAPTKRDLKPPKEPATRTSSCVNYLQFLNPAPRMTKSSEKVLVPMNENDHSGANTPVVHSIHFCGLAVGWRTSFGPC